MCKQISFICPPSPPPQREEMQVFFLLHVVPEYINQMPFHLYLPFNLSLSVSWYPANKLASLSSSIIFFPLRFLIAYLASCTPFPGNSLLFNIITQVSIAKCDWPQLRSAADWTDTKQSCVCVCETPIKSHNYHQLAQYCLVATLISLSYSSLLQYCWFQSQETTVKILLLPKFINKSCISS